MCGGFVVAYSSSKIDSTFSKTHQFIAHLIYSLGRVSSYTLLGAIFGYLGSVISFSRTSTGYFYFVVGAFMVLMGLSLMGKIKFLTSLECMLSTNALVKPLFSKFIHSKSLFSFYALGALNGFMPCGLVYFFAISAATTGSIFWGAMTMFIFGLSTIPSLLGFGYIIGFLRSGNFRESMIKLASITIILYGIYTAYLGYIAVVSQ